jgi:hypothetical protein
MTTPSKSTMGVTLCRLCQSGKCAGHKRNRRHRIPGAYLVPPRAPAPLLAQDVAQDACAKSAGQTHWHKWHKVNPIVSTSRKDP